MVGYLKLYFWVFISLELFHAKWELHIVNNYQINVQKVNLSKFYPRNPLFTPQNGFERSAELKPILTMSARPQMTHTTQKINLDRPVTRTPLFLTQESALMCFVAYNSSNIIFNEFCGNKTNWLSVATHEISPDLAPREFSDEKMREAARAKICS